MAAPSDHSEVILKDPAGFANEFLGICLQQGFQSLSKRDLELLVFFLLEKDGAISRTASNYDVARLLRINVTRVKSLRRDAYARWQATVTVDRAAILRGIFERLLTLENVAQAMVHVSSAERQDGFIAVRVDHPADLAELEHEIIRVGAIPKYERNREVLLVRFDTILRVGEALGMIDPAKEAAVKYLKKHCKGTTTVKELLKKDLSEINWPEVREALNDAAVEAVTTGSSLAFSALLKVVGLG